MKAEVLNKWLRYMKDTAKRMRERFLNEGPKGFQDHELLEMILYYTDRRKKYECRRA